MPRTGKEFAPEPDIHKPMRYSRLIIVREINSQLHALVQLLDNGLVVFPGGQEKSTDGDPIETIVRECGEEGVLNREQLRTLRNYDLLWGSFVFPVEWMQRGYACVDTYHLILAVDDNYMGLRQTQDPEISSTSWVNLQDLANGIVPFPANLPQNIQGAASKAMALFPELIKTYRA